MLFQKPIYINVKLFNEFNFVMSKLNYVIDCIKIEERIRQWYFSYEGQFLTLRNEISRILTSLRETYLINACKLLDDRSTDSITIQTVCEKFLLRTMITDKTKKESFRQPIVKIKNEIYKSAEIIDKLKDSRDNYLAHFDKGMSKHDFAYSKEILDNILQLCINIHNEFNKIVKLIQGIAITLTSKIYPNQIDHLFFEYLVGDDILYSETNTAAYYKKFPFPNDVH